VKKPLHVYQVIAPYLADEALPPPPGGAASSPGVSQTPVATETGIRIHLLGQFRVIAGGRELRDAGWTKQKARQLLKCLLTRPRRRMTTDEAIDLFWPDADQDAALKTLRSTLSALRGALGASGSARGQGLVATLQGAVLIPPEANVWVDADEFERLLTQARVATDPLPLLEQADALYAGDYLANDLYESWAEERRESLRRQWSDLQHTLADVREQQGDTEAAAAALRRLLQADPCDERAARALMRLLAKHARRSDALRIHDRLVESLRAIDAEAEEATSILRQQIAAGHTQWDIEPPAIHTHSTNLSPPAPASSQQDAGDDASSPRSIDPKSYIPSYPFPAPDRLIGRIPEMNTAEQVLERGREGCQVLLLSAPAGTGKSALAGAIVRRAQRTGYLCLVGGGYEQQGVVPYGPFHEAFAEYLLAADQDWIRSNLGTVTSDLADIVPELQQHMQMMSDPSATPADQMRLFGAVHTLLRVLAAQGPVLICLEDLHAADAASFNLIRFIARQTRRLPVVLVGTFRSDEVQPADALGQLEAVLLREGAEQIKLSQLARYDAGRMVETVLDGPVSPSLIAQLHDATGGNPLFLEQFILALREDGRVEPRDGIWQSVRPLGQTLPPITQAVIGHRLNRLGQECREVLSVAAVLGRTIDYAVLAAMLQSMREIEIAEALEEALTSQLIQETPSGYAFSHGLLREVLYARLSRPRRRLLHARAGDVLEELYDSSQRPGELAYHYLLAGTSSELRAKALHYSLEAGRQAAKLFSHREALQHFDNAAELLSLVEIQLESAPRFEVAIQRAHACRSTGYWSRALEHAREARDLTEDPMERAQSHEICAHALLQMSQGSLAHEEGDAGLAELAKIATDAGTSRIRFSIRQHQAQVLFLRGRGHALLELGGEMLADAQQSGEPGARIAGHKALSAANILLGRIDDGIREDQMARDIAVEQDDLIDLAVRESNLAVDHAMAGHFALAHDGFQRAIDICRSVGAEHRAVNSLLWLGRVNLAEGDVEQARANADLALRLAQDVGVRFLPDCHNVIGAVQIAECNWNAAEASFKQSLTLRNRGDQLAGCIVSLIGLGEAYLHQGKWDLSRQSYTEAVETGESMDPGPYLVAARRGLGQFLLCRDDREHALGQLESAMELARTMPTSVERPLTILALAESTQSSSPEVRLEMVTDALSLGLPSGAVITANLRLAELRGVLGDWSTARSNAESALEQAESFKSAYLLGQAWLAQAMQSVHSGRQSGVALSQLSNALDWFKRAGSAVGYKSLLNAADDCCARLPEMKPQIRKLLNTLQVT
jgi:DNA-binding SARP family transcriptional activator